MKLDRKRLDDVLSILGTAVGNKIIKAASYVRFNVDKKKRKVTLYTTDFHAYLAMDFGDVSLADIDDVDDVFLIDYRMISSIVKNSTTDLVEIINNDKTTIHVITDGVYRFGKLENPDEFPSIDFTYDSYVKWPVPLIGSAWNKARIAVSKDVTKINYQGVYFDGSFAATDNRRLSVVKGIEYSGKPMLIPPVFGDVLKHCKNEVEVGINSTTNLLVITCHEIGLVAAVRLIDASFADYRRIIDSKSASATIIVNKQKLLGAISRLIPFTDKLFQVVELSVVGKGIVRDLKLKVENNDAGEEIIRIDGFTCVKDINNIEWKYHIENFYDGVSVTDNQEVVTIEFQGDGKMWIVEENFTYLQTEIKG